jgi:hypothetical protein
MISMQIVKERKVPLWNAVYMSGRYIFISKFYRGMYPGNVCLTHMKLRKFSFYKDVCDALRQTTIVSSNSYVSYLTL